MKCGALGTCLEVELSAVALDDDGMGNRETLSGALADVFSGEEGIIHALANVLRNAGTVVGDADVDVRVFLFGSDPQGAQTLSVGLFDGVQGIDDEVHEHLVQIPKSARHVG